MGTVAAELSEDNSNMRMYLLKESVLVVVLALQLVINEAKPDESVTVQCGDQEGACEGEDCSPSWTPIPNIGAALVGYDPYLGDRLASSDPGMRSRIFQATKQGHDGRYEALDSIGFKDDVTCTISQSSLAVTSYEGYIRHISAHGWYFESSQSSSNNEESEAFWSRFLGYRRAVSDFKSSSSSTSSSFGISGSYNSVSSFFTQTKGEIHLNAAECQMYMVSVKKFSKYKFEDSFVNGLKKLAEAAENPDLEKSKENLRAFISEYGTYYMSKSWLGAKLLAKSLFFHQSRSEAELNQRSLCLSTAFSTSSGDTKIHNMNVGYGTWLGNLNKYQSSKSSSQNSSSSKLELCGSYSKLDQNGRSIGFAGTSVSSVGSYPISVEKEGFKDAHDNPSVIKFGLTPLENLFEPDTLMNYNITIDSTKLKDYFSSAVGNYCLTMLGVACPPVRECGIQNLCGPFKTCQVDNSTTEGYKCLDGSAVLLIGGTNNLMEAWSPDARSDLPSFRHLDSKVAGGLGTRASVLVDLVYVCGGSNKNGTVFDSCWTASVSGGEWTQVGSLKTPRKYHTLNILDDEILIATGGIEKYENSNPVLSNSIESFSSDIGWILRSTTLPVRDAKHCVLNLDEKDKVLYISGIGSSTITKVEIINIETGERKTLQPPESSFGGAHYCAKNGNTVFLSEQQQMRNGSPERENKVWELSLDDESWTPLALVYDASPQGLDVVAGDLYFFGADGVQELKNEGWHRVPSQNQPAPRGELDGGPAILVL